MNRFFLYPLWLRLWHWTNAFLFFVLILSGISLHFSDSGSLLVPFEIAIVAHNIAGLVISFVFIIYTIFNIFSGNYKQYIPQLRNFFPRMLKQINYYILGIFLKEEHPYHTNTIHKFNPLQQISYFVIIFFFMPLIIISGILLMFPEFAPDEIMGMGGVWPMALLHTIIGFFLSIFLTVHIYLGTTGRTLGELYKSIITGWHLSEESEIDIATRKKIVEEEKKSARKLKLFSEVIFNTASLTGAIIALVSFSAIILLIVVDFFFEHVNPYSGIVTFVILPMFLLIGIFLIIFGIIRENRKALAQKVRKLPVIDLNNPKHQIATIVVSVSSIFLILFIVFGSFKTYEYTDSNDFCGQVCHEVMNPEYVTYLNSPHSRVECVDCHISGNSDWYVRLKLTLFYQLYSVLFNKYSKPIQSVEQPLRPSQESCEQCHWPVYFYNEKNEKFNFYLSDEDNTEYKLNMSMKVGGGNSDLGLHDGIHWHMNIANEITYYATDKDRTTIPWVMVKSLVSDKETVYKSADSILSDEITILKNARKFDCMDCHNRPSHIFKQPHKILNSLLSNNKIDKTLPYIKKLGIQALENNVTKRETSYNDIKKIIWGFYNENYPDLVTDKKNEIDFAIVDINNIYIDNYFPEMNVNWKAYPDNLGHLYSKGCFRCHDGKHINEVGDIIPNDCNTCHTITYQQAPNTENLVAGDGQIQFIHPGGIDKMVQTALCSDCHGVKRK